MSFHLVETARFRRQLNSWGLDDVTRIDVYLRLHQLQDNPQLLLQQSTSPPEGMIYAFSFVDCTFREKLQDSPLKQIRALSILV